MIRSLLTLICALTIFILIDCSQSPTIAGGTGQEGEARTIALQGKALYSDGSPAVKAIVRLRSSNYLADPLGIGLPKRLKLADSSVTDDSGWYSIDSVDRGSFFLEINDNAYSAVGIACTLTIADTLRKLATSILRPCATVIGTIAPASDSGPVFVQIYGMERLAQVDPLTRQFVFPDLPAGSYTVRIAPASPELGRVNLATGSISATAPASLAEVTLHTFASETYASWAHSARLTINTSVTGANISEDVYAFPLLVRLNSNNFNFSQANERGIDLRFSSSSGAPLRYDIEQWDPVNGQAVIWVLVDTIHGNNDSQFITMHWGNSVAPDFSNGAAVFDSTRFSGAWHMGGSQYLSDATFFGNDAVDHGTIGIDGAVGGARFFNGQSWMSVADAPSLEPSSFTLSCWFKRNGPQSVDCKLVNKGNTFNPFQSYTLEFRDPTTVAGFQMATQDTTFHTLFTQPAVADARWYHLAGTFDAATGKGKLYLDGSAVDSFVVNSPIQYYPTAAHDLIFGSVKGNHAFFKGAIDEVLLARSALSPAWIMLCEKTQRNEVTVITFK